MNRNLKLNGRRLLPGACALWLLPAFMVLFLPGCEWMRGNRLDESWRYRVDDRSPREPEHLAARPAAADDQPSSAALAAAQEGIRPGNPQGWGASAMMAVGREFEPVFFTDTSTELDYAARRRLNEYAQWFRENSRVWIALAGYCDADNSVRFGYNLAMARALAVEDYLAGEGIDRRRLFPISYGMNLPEVEPGNPQASELNNRVEVMGFIAPVGQAAPPPIKESAAPPPEVVRQAPEPSGREIP